MKAICYLRVSTVEQDISPEFQRDKIVQFCNDHKFNYHIYQDIGVSGSKEIHQREGLQAALNALQKGDVFIVYKLDRLARNLLLQLSIEELIKTKKCSFVSVMGEGTGGDSSPEKELFRQMIAVFSQFERGQIKQRTKNALGQLKKQGKVYGKIPYGYLREGSYLVKFDTEQAIIKRVKEMRKTMSYHKIVKALNAEGLKSRCGNAWQYKQIYNICASED